MNRRSVRDFYNCFGFLKKLFLAWVVLIRFYFIFTCLRDCKIKLQLLRLFGGLSNVKTAKQSTRGCLVPRRFLAGSGATGATLVPRQVSWERRGKNILPSVLCVNDNRSHGPVCNTPWSLAGAFFIFHQTLETARNEAGWGGNQKFKVQVAIGIDKMPPSLPYCWWTWYL